MRAEKILARLCKHNTFTVQKLDVNSSSVMQRLMQNYDLVAAALPWPATWQAILSALAVRRPFVSITRPQYETIDVLKKLAAEHENLIMVGCGLEPGLTELFAHYALSQLDTTDNLHVRCGGIPCKPLPPLYHKVIFGGTKLPINARPAYYIKNGTSHITPRFSDIELIDVEGIGTLEAWHDGMLPWIVDWPGIASVQLYTQKTLRWPGFAQKVKCLQELGLTDVTPINIKGISITPREFIDVLLYPTMKFTDSDRDIVCLQLEAHGRKNNRKAKYKMELRDYFDECTTFTAMARVTGFTLSSIAYRVAMSEIVGSGFLTIEEAISQKNFIHLMEELKETGIQFICQLI
jgi:lysine 6-dehydrogenase